MAKTFKRTNAVTIPVLKQRETGSVFVGFLSAPFESETHEAGKDPATIAKVENLETGEPAVLVLGETLAGDLLRTYGESIVGACVEIVKNPKPEGKKYHTYTVWGLDAKITLNPANYTAPTGARVFKIAKDYEAAKAEYAAARNKK